jgi:hypothetical protein
MPRAKIDGGGQLAAQPTAYCRDLSRAKTWYLTEEGMC